MQTVILIATFDIDSIIYTAYPRIFANLYSPGLQLRFVSRGGANSDSNNAH